MNPPQTEKKSLLAITTGSWVRGALVVVAALALLQVVDVLLAILTSVIIASAIEPAAMWARKRGIPRLPAVISLYVLLAAVIAGIFYFLFLPLIGEISSFIKTLTVYSNANSEGGVLSTMFADQKVFGGLENSILSANEISSYINSLSEFFSRGMFSSVSVISGGLVSLVLIIVLSFYLAVQDDGVGKFLRIITPYKQEKYIIGLWKRSQYKIGLWMQGQLLSSTIIATLVYFGLLALGVDHALLLAVLAGAFELIPIFGPIMAAIPALFVAFVSGGTPLLILVAGFYLIIQQFENNLIYPLVVKKLVGVPPTVSIIALVLGGKLAGFLGVIIAVPVAAILMELLSDFEAEKTAKISSENIISSNE
jgi:predicted PurR-regulated permease PerM